MWQALLLCCCLTADAPKVRTHFHQVFPPPATWGAILPAPFEFTRSPDKHCAIVLVNGCQPHPGNTNYKVEKPKFQPWQEPDSALVKRLGSAADVYAFAYSQNTAVDEVARAPDLLRGIRRLKALRYREIVLLGHSAGSIIVRQFVEDNPDAGVTRVIQVSALNGGSAWASVWNFYKLPLPGKMHGAFLHSLTRKERSKVNALRAGIRIPKKVKFTCVIGTKDWIVTPEDQCPADLRQQGIKVVELKMPHPMPHKEKHHGFGELCAVVTSELGLGKSPGSASLPPGKTRDEPRVITEGKRLIAAYAEQICRFAHAEKVYGYKTHEFVGHRRTEDGYFELTCQFNVKGWFRNQKMHLSFYFKDNGQFKFLRVNDFTTALEPFTKASAAYLKKMRTGMTRRPAVQADSGLLRRVDNADARELCEIYLRLQADDKDRAPAGP